MLTSKSKFSKLLFIITYLLSSTFTCSTFAHQSSNQFVQPTTSSQKQVTTHTNSIGANKRKLQYRIAGWLISTVGGGVVILYCLYLKSKKQAVRNGFNSPSTVNNNKNEDNMINHDKIKLPVSGNDTPNTDHGNVEVNKPIKKIAIKEIDPYKIGDNPVQAIRNQLIKEEEKAKFDRNITEVTLRIKNQNEIEKEVSHIQYLWGSKNYRRVVDNHEEAAKEAINQIDKIISSNKIKGKEVVDLYAHLVEKFTLSKQPNKIKYFPWNFVRQQAHTLDLLIEHRSPITEHFLVSLLLTTSKKADLLLNELGMVISKLTKLAPNTCMQILQQLLEDENKRIRANVVKSLMFFKEYNIPNFPWITALLDQAMEDEESDVKAAAIYITTKLDIQNKRFLEKIFQEAKTSNIELLKRVSIGALGYFGVRRAIPFLISLLEVTSRPMSIKAINIRRSAAEAIKKFAKKGMLTKEDMEEIEAYTEDNMCLMGSPESKGKKFHTSKA